MSFYFWFPYSSILREDGLLTAGQQELPWGGSNWWSAASELCEGELQCCVVCGQCVQGKIRPAAVLCGRRQDTFEAHERGLSARLSAGRCNSSQEDEPELHFDGQRWEKLDQAGGNENHGTLQTAGFNPGGSHQQRTVSESIIYFRILNMNLIFLDRYTHGDSLQNHEAPQDLEKKVTKQLWFPGVNSLRSCWPGTKWKGDSD